MALFLKTHQLHEQIIGGGGLPPPACKTNEGRELVTFDKIYIFTNNIFNKSGGVGLGVYRGVGVYIEE